MVPKNKITRGFAFFNRCTNFSAGRREFPAQGVGNTAESDITLSLESSSVGRGDKDTKAATCSYRVSKYLLRHATSGAA
jgi:hypothetical protein